MPYISLKDYAKNMNIQTGDTVLITSDARKMIWDAITNKSNPDLNLLIDGLIEQVGENGTVIFPTYNWDFCSGKTFDYKSTPCMTGVLGTLALKREDFSRTKHPIYSFAVWGKHKDEFFQMDNTDSFSLDSPFAFFWHYNVKNYIIDVTLKHCFTFAHFVEQQSGLVKHRYIKKFSAGYIDENGIKSQRTYSMFVRDLDLDVITTIDPIEDDFLRCNAERKLHINSSEIKEIYLGKAYDILLEDIKQNRSRKLCIFKGQ